MEMNKNIKNTFIENLRKQGIKNKQVLDSMSSISREMFIEPALRMRAYDQDALPIGHSQTISSPFIVAKMTEEIFEQDNMNKVLEIGTGCGYQTAILATLFKKVITVERIKALHEKSQKILHELEMKNIKFIHANGFDGYEKESPYDAIILTAAPKKIPDSLIRQLSLNGRMILPLGDDGSQKLFRLKKTRTGVNKKDLDDVRFVPMLDGVV